jgi:hypothetical protein
MHLFFIALCQSLANEKCV